MEHSIIEFFPDDSPNNCGYCSGTDCSLSTGMWAHFLTVDDYQDLINRNWRRSGKYCYHPQMRNTCCPAYMIKCEVNSFKLGKHHKKLIKKFNRYLMTGQLTVTDSGDSSTGSIQSKERSQQIETTSQSATASARPTQSAGQSGTPRQFAKGVGADPNKPKAIKAKQMRLQKKQKIEGGDSSAASVGISSNQEKSLEDLLNEYNPKEAKHKFELRLVRNHPISEEFEDTKMEEYEVYKKYQMAVHKDPESKVNFNQFRRFLIDSPLVEEKRCGVDLGSFHYQYILDGKIIAVEVMDILPEFISSKYFFYDPEYEFLTLGTYSTFRSIYFIQKLSERLTSLQYYLMGYYIHTCQKMRYKAKFTPSYLLCPETYNWIPVEQCVPKLDENKYSRLCSDPAQVDVDGAKDTDYKSTFCLHKRQVIPYGILTTRLRRPSDDAEEVKKYTNLIGSKLNKSLLLFRA